MYKRRGVSIRYY